MSQSKKKEQEIQRRLAKARKRIEILNELKKAGLKQEDAPLIGVLPSNRHKRTSTPRLTTGLRSYRNQSRIERAIMSNQYRCRFFFHEYRSDLRQRLALRHHNPVFLNTNKTAWSELFKTHQTYLNNKQRKLP